MLKFSSALPSSSDAAQTSRAELAPNILRLAGGDPAIARQIRETMWSDYCSAGSPNGHSEAGMMVWWHDRVDGQRTAA